MGQNRAGALFLLVRMLAAIDWANGSLTSYDAFWKTHLMVGVGDLQLRFHPARARE